MVKWFLQYLLKQNTDWKRRKNDPHNEVWTFQTTKLHKKLYFTLSSAFDSCYFRWFLHPIRLGFFSSWIEKVFQFFKSSLPIGLRPVSSDFKFDWQKPSVSGTVSQGIENIRSAKKWLALCEFHLINNNMNWRFYHLFR